MIRVTVANFLLLLLAQGCILFPFQNMHFPHLFMIKHLSLHCDFFCVRRYDNLCACKQPICGKCQQRQLTLCEINIPNTHSIYISCKNTIEHARLLHLPQGVCEKHFFGFHPHYSYNLFICSTPLDLLNCSRNLCPFLAKVRYETQPADSHISTSVNTVTWSK